MAAQASSCGFLLRVLGFLLSRSLHLSNSPPQSTEPRPSHLHPSHRVHLASVEQKQKSDMFALRVRTCSSFPFDVIVSALNSTRRRVGNPQDGYTPAHVAVLPYAPYLRDSKNFSQEMLFAPNPSLQMLINAGVNLEAKNKEGYTPVLLAITRAQVSAVEMLVRAKVNLEVKNEVSRALHDYRHFS